LDGVGVEEVVEGSFGWGIVRTSLVDIYLFDNEDEMDNEGPIKAGVER